MPSKELYIGNINPDTKTQEIREIFQLYGNINRCDMKFGNLSIIKNQLFKILVKYICH